RAFRQTLLDNEMQRQSPPQRRCKTDMTFNQAALENVTTWCRASLELASERREARARFFGEDDPRPVE
ncbi:MAG TPA: hypothetical protein VIK11_07950, partial [Tepidiformaceae bacterium]